MSIVFTLEGCSIAKDDWADLIWDYLNGNDLAPFDEEVVNEDVGFVSVPGSSRGFLIDLSGDDVDFRFNALSSRTD